MRNFSNPKCDYLQPDHGIGRSIRLLAEGHPANASYKRELLPILLAPHPYKK
jgi:hypothetical protein